MKGSKPNVVYEAVHLQSSSRVVMRLYEPSSLADPATICQKLLHHRRATSRRITICKYRRMY